MPNAPVAGRPLAGGAVGDSYAPGGAQWGWGMRKITPVTRASPSRAARRVPAVARPRSVLPAAHAIAAPRSVRSVRPWWMPPGPGRLFTNGACILYICTKGAKCRSSSRSRRIVEPRAQVSPGDPKRSEHPIRQDCSGRRISSLGHGLRPDGPPIKLIANPIKVRTSWSASTHRVMTIDRSIAPVILPAWRGGPHPRFRLITPPGSGNSVIDLDSPRSSWRADSALPSRR